MTHANVLTTADGCMYTQQANGWFTDGDTEFDVNNTDIFGLLWQATGNYYCADGDGLVVVEFDGHGNFYVADQGDLVGKFDSLRAALMCAQSTLADNYPAVYESNIE